MIRAFVTSFQLRFHVVEVKILPDEHKTLYGGRENEIMGKLINPNIIPIAPRLFDMFRLHP